MLKLKKVAITALLLTIALLTPNAFALKIDLNQVNPNQFADLNGLAALAGFEEAVAFWESTFTDDVTLNFDISFAALPANVLGSTGTNSSVFFYENVALGMINDISSAEDLISVNNIACDRSQGGEFTAPGPCAISFLDSEVDALGATTAELDNDGSNDNYFLGLTQANAKALGFTADDFGNFFGNSADANIIFSSEFAFDFDRTDGITANEFDFIGIAIHEIGHALGFTSGVDSYDSHNDSGINNLDNFAVNNTLDLFKFSSDSLIAGTGVLDLRPGANTYFSIDGGLTAIAPFSTGRLGGDGQQASHWKDNQGLGALDPTVSNGEFVLVSELDLLAFDVIGWDLAVVDVPEPGVLILLLTSTAILVRRRKN
ncbi:MAG: hypothetical protein ACI9UT_002819 [Flavobacteriales bacterium]|jgi:hypothetical protein